MNYYWMCSKCNIIRYLLYCDGFDDNISQHINIYQKFLEPYDESMMILRFQSFAEPCADDSDIYTSATQSKYSYEMIYNEILIYDYAIY